MKEPSGEPFKIEHLREIETDCLFRIIKGEPEALEYNKNLIYFNLKGYGIVQIKSVNTKQNRVSFRTYPPLPASLGFLMSIDKFSQLAISRLKGVE